ncbi:MAG: hypothetical protein JKX69_04445 [Rhodobacteraceae bacterium]|nr:hypothetical protein [Paracoccaceae bacterium]
MIYLVPTDPSFEPTLTPEAAARAALDAVLPSNVELRITSQSHDAPRLFDAGKNFYSVACPHCSTNISLDWWSQN